MSTHALASLTATYTDSEPEDEKDASPFTEDKNCPDEKEKENSLQPNIIQNSQLEVSSKVTKLVSYHDDNVISDEEGEYFYYKNEVEDSESEHHENFFDGMELPPEPSGKCSPHLIEKVLKLHEKIENGLDMNNMIQSRKDFRNPSIYEKLIQFCGLNELGTNYPANVYDPLKWGKESFYEELAKTQKIEMDKREKEKKERTKVEFISGTKKSNSLNDEEIRKRKSKWDQVGASAAGSVTLGLIGPAGLLQPSLTTNVTGTKGTVYSLKKHLIGLVCTNSTLHIQK
ncbi:SAP30-binding protein, putative [Pediculus humanus corporis]|uniref:SAP30-binding protein, putative n=1 Tax=Pediculus humanus subsp. corporis TaxID=121224 RepID=E0VQK7_PEDHC|nr:SAP30-binding protein, putative [Pediculus humanus corporis]EEB15663.1 SAP30-binding protein, putative [Pediculus humanus corporis]